MPPPGGFFLQSSARRPETARQSDADIYDDLLAALAKEPCVLERDQMTAELLESPRKLRKGMTPR